MLSLRDCRIGVIGLGYVGLPLAVEFGKKFLTRGFDTNPERIRELKAGRDSTREVSARELREATMLTVTSRLRDLKSCRVFIVTVPTPIDEYKRPDLGPLLLATESVVTRTSEPSPSAASSNSPFLSVDQRRSYAVDTSCCGNA